jgi:cytochrome oxidase Cu insertion factor (SCO1/SenC/PrrC family)
MKWLSTVIAAAMLGGTLGSAGAPQQGAAPPRQPVDVSRLGPQVGERVPDFTLTDQNGKSWTLQSLMGPSGAMLVFFRSADW